MAKIDEIVRDSAMKAACQGLSFEELRALNPNLLRAAPAIRKALRGIIMVARPVNSNSTMVFEKEYRGAFSVLGSRLETACEALVMAEDK